MGGSAANTKVIAHLAEFAPFISCQSVAPRSHHKLGRRRSPGAALCEPVTLERCIPKQRRCILQIAPTEVQFHSSRAPGRTFIVHPSSIGIRLPIVKTQKQTMPDTAKAPCASSAPCIRYSRPCICERAWQPAGGGDETSLAMSPGSGRNCTGERSRRTSVFFHFRPTVDTGLCEGLCLEQLCDTEGGILPHRVVFDEASNAVGAGRSHER